MRKLRRGMLVGQQIYINIGESTTENPSSKPIELNMLLIDSKWDGDYLWEAEHLRRVKRLNLIFHTNPHTHI